MRVIVRAVLTGAVAAAAGTVPWAVLAAANLKFFPGVPWCVPVMALYLRLLWRHAPRTNLRANRLSEDVWGAALVAGVLGLWALVLGLNVLNRLVRLPPQQVGDMSQVPVLTVVALFAMGAVVAGFVEEASFRGYMQRPIEQRYGPVVAILVTGSVFGFAHFTHPEVTLILMPYYLAVAAIYGTLAYLTNSIWPSIVLHAGGNMFVAIDFFARGQSEWQTSANPGAADLGNRPRCVVRALGPWPRSSSGRRRSAAYASLAAVARHAPAISRMTTRRRCPLNTRVITALGSGTSTAAAVCGVGRHGERSRSSSAFMKARSWSRSPPRTPPVGSKANIKRIVLQRAPSCSTTTRQIALSGRRLSSVARMSTPAWGGTNFRSLASWIMLKIGKTMMPCASWTVASTRKPPTCAAASTSSTPGVIGIEGK